MEPNSQYLVSFTDEILNKKLCFAHVRCMVANELSPV